MNKSDALYIIPNDNGENADIYLKTDNSSVGYISYLDCDSPGIHFIYAGEYGQYLYYQFVCNWITNYKDKGV